MQYLDANSKTTELSLFISKTNHSISGWSKPMAKPVTLKKLKVNGSKITADGDCSHEIKRRLLLGRKVMTKLDRILKSRDVT